MKRLMVGIVAAVILTGCTSAGPGPNASSDGGQPPSSAVTTSPASASPTATQTGRDTPSAIAVAPVDRSQRSSQLATTVLAGLAIKGRAPKTGYSREQFGSTWTDDNNDPDGHNGCDTRNDILRRDLTAKTIKPDSNGCTVLTGVLHDPYTSHSIAFVRGEATSSRIEIDHVVALSDAWQKGAQRFDEQTRINFANDPLNLLAVDGPTNESKGDGDDATWLPPNKAYRCAYVARQIEVKASYGLWMSAAEHDAAGRVLAACPGQTVPTEAGQPAVSQPTSTTSSAPRLKTTTPRPPPVTSTSDVYYPNCDAVRAAGAAPLHRGDPGYSSKLDRDGDGVACEN